MPRKEKDCSTRCFVIYACILLFGGAAALLISMNSYQHDLQEKIENELTHKGDWKPSLIRMEARFHDEMFELQCTHPRVISLKSQLKMDFCRYRTKLPTNSTAEQNPWMYTTFSGNLPRHSYV